VSQLPRSRRWDRLQQDLGRRTQGLFPFPLVAGCVFVGFCGFQPPPPCMGMGAVEEEEGYCGASVARVWLGLSCERG